MKLRWFRTYDSKTGMKTEYFLQYWDEVDERWECVGFVECKEEYEEAYLTNKTIRY